MKDLDFDELDQAVNSVLGTDTTAAEPKAEQSAPAPAATPTSPAPVVPAESTPAAPQPAAPTSVPTPTASPAVRRRGQFLDMVHPASKMTNQSTSATPATLRKKITPVSSDVVPQAATPAPVTPPADTSTPPETTPPVTIDESPSSTSSSPAWPDPLDLVPIEETKTEEKPAESDTTDTAETTENVSSTTPFVTDAKVDKRPLDAFTANEAAPEETKDATPDTSTEPAIPAIPELPKLDEGSEVKDMPKPQMIDTTPPELQPDVVSVESDSGNELIDPTVSEASDVSTSPAESGLTQSIPQQYKTPAAASDEENTPHPIFDTHEYHQPLLPASSKKSRSWLVILIIVLLLVVGAALGYFAFMAGL